MNRYDPLTREEVISVIAGESIARRVPVNIHFWVHADTFGEREAAVKEILHRYPEWRQATVVSENFLGRLRVLLHQAPDGAILEGPPLPTWVRPARGAERTPRVFGAAIFSTYSIEAWARMQFPQRRILVRSAPTLEGAQACPDEVLLVFTSRLAGY